MALGGPFATSRARWTVIGARMSLFQSTRSGWRMVAGRAMSAMKARRFAPRWGTGRSREHGAERCASSLPSRDRFTFHADLTLGARLSLTCGDHTRGQERPRATRRAGRGGIVSTARADRTTGDRLRFECFVSCLRHHPKPGRLALRAAATMHRQTARHGERSLRLRCSCFRVWACTSPFVVTRRLSARGGPDSVRSASCTPLR